MIWFSQILRIIELQYSITTQLIDVVKTTILVLPSFINPLMPFLIILGSFFLNYKLSSSNEIIILKQYFSVKDNLIIFIILSLGIFIFYLINNEILSVKLYHKYKVQELEIRNNLKLGVPSVNEFHIEDEVSIFYKKQSNNIFYDVEAVIFNGGQFIKSSKAKIEIENKNYNLIFNKGERVILNEVEKSKTDFDKFVYSIENKEIEDLTFDKEHFNTFQLLNSENSEFFYHGHNRIYQYFLTLVIIFISFRVFFIYSSKKTVFKYYFYLFLVILIIQLINSYLLYILKNNLSFNLYYYYLVNILITSIFSYFIFYFNENN